MIYKNAVLTFIVSILSFFLTHYQSVAQVTIIQNTEGRQNLSLDGTWQVIVDPLQTGYYDHRYLPSNNGFFKNAKRKSLSDLIEYDFDDALELNVPGDWNTQMEKLYYYEGTIWYKRSFDYKIKSDKRVFIHFGAINYEAKIYLNGKKIGNHTGGFTSFSIEVTGNLKDKDNFLIVMVDNTRKRDAVPTINTDWWNYGGITRSVKLVETPKIFIKDYFIQLKKGSMDEVLGWVQLSDSVSKEVCIKIPELKIVRKVRTDANGYASVDFTGKFQLWEPSNPKLYSIELHSDDDKIEDKIGFRSINTNGSKIELNGKPIFLKGVSIHEEAPFKAGRVTSKDQCEVLVKWAKELGCNFIRLAHYPHSEDMIKVAEREGLLVWSEIPVYWTVLFENQDTYTNAQNQLEDMIARDRNRTNIILWSVANETPMSDSRIKFLSKLVTDAKNLDSTRLITAALDTYSSNDGNVMINDSLGNYIDVIGINKYCGWYSGVPESCATLKWASTFNKPLIVSEFGAGALQGFHGDANERWTEEYQDAVYKSNIEMLKNINFLAGTTPWILKDFLSPKRLLEKFQKDYNRKGLISERGIKKKAFYTLQAWYRELGKN